VILKTVHFEAILLTVFSVLAFVIHTWNWFYRILQYWVFDIVQIAGN